MSSALFEEPVLNMDKHQPENQVNGQIQNQPMAFPRLQRQKKMVQKKSKIENEFSLKISQILINQEKNIEKFNKDQKIIIEFQLINEQGKIIMEEEICQSLLLNDENRNIQLEKQVNIEEKQFQIKSVLARIPGIYLVLNLRKINENKEEERYSQILKVIEQDINKNIKVQNNNVTLDLIQLENQQEILQSIKSKCSKLQQNTQQQQIQLNVEIQKN